jgi:hypothetical protein
VTESNQKSNQKSNLKSKIKSNRITTATEGRASSFTMTILADLARNDWITSSRQPVGVAKQQINAQGFLWVPLAASGGIKW